MNWKGKRVLVTGADGFIGSHVTERLAREGARVRAFCYYNSQGTLGWLDQSSTDVLPELDVILGDVRDARFVEQACKDIEVVFHLAALVAIPYSYIAAESFIATNVTGTLNVLEAARRHGVGRVVITSTSEVYGTPDSIPIRETHPLNAFSPYAASKIAADQLALSYHRTFNVPATILRPFNTFGPRQSTRAVTATILTQLLSGRKTIRLGRLDTKRDMTFVSDVVEGFLQAGCIPGIEGQVIQLGTGRAVSIGELFDLACKLTGIDGQVMKEAERIRPAEGEVMVLVSDPSRANKILNWAPKVTLEQGLEATIDWLRANLAKYKPDFLYP